MAETKIKNSKDTYDLAVIGGGPAGMAAAWAAAKTGVKRILLIERNERLGGILPQCIHNGFGVGLYDRDYTGPEYATLWEEKLQKEELEILCESTVLHIRKNGEYFTLSCLGMQVGFAQVQAKTVILACGCRERTLGQMRIPGSRPAGIYMAGSAQFMVNISNLKPGSNVAILGFGDIGLIMARRLLLEGMKVRVIFGEQANGLVRNYVQCIREFGIESRISYTLISTHGYRRLKGITIAPKDESGHILYQQKEYIPCDTLLVAAGLIPEAELWKELCESLNENGGIPINEQGETPVKGVYACGNVTDIADLVDKVTMAGVLAGGSASKYLHQEEDRIEEFIYEQEKNRKKINLYSPRKMNNQIPVFDQFVCSICPNGCIIQPNKSGFVGQRCNRGLAFAEEYIRIGQAKYTLSTTVKMKNSRRKLLAVRTNLQITKEEMVKIMPKLRKVVVSAPVMINQVVWESKEINLQLLAAENVYE